MGSWRNTHRRPLKKVVYALTDHGMNKLIQDHENRGWERGSEVKEYGYGFGCLMVFNNGKGEQLNGTKTKCKSNCP